MPDNAPYVKCPDCPKSPETCWLAPHLCSHPLRRKSGKPTQVERLRAALDDAIRLADHWAPKDGPDAALAARELADLRAIANERFATGGHIDSPTLLGADRGSGQ